MTRLTIRYHNKTNRIIQTYWGGSTPTWLNEERKETTVTTTETTQQNRSDALESALNSVEAGADYDPDIETPVAVLCYDPNTDELYGDVDIRPVQE